MKKSRESEERLRRYEQHRASVPLRTLNETIRSKSTIKFIDFRKSLEESSNSSQIFNNSDEMNWKSGRLRYLNRNLIDTRESNSPIKSSEPKLHRYSGILTKKYLDPSVIRKQYQEINEVKSKLASKHIPSRLEEIEKALLLNENHVNNSFSLLKGGEMLLLNPSQKHVYKKTIKRRKNIIK